MTSERNEGMEEWYNYLELFLAVDCLIMLTYNISVLIVRKVY